MDYEKVIGKTIKIIRVLMSWKQIDLADKACLTQPVISAMEKGASLSIPNLRLVLGVYGQTFPEFFSLVDYMVEIEDDDPQLPVKFLNRMAQLREKI